MGPPLSARTTPVDQDRVEELGTILSIWAHPDDETFLAGGIMAAAAARGQRVVCVCATAGERGTDDPARWPPERLGRIRRFEAAAAMAVLGVAEHHFLDLADGGLAVLDPGAPVERLATMLAEVQPDTILTFGPDGATFHPDHQAVSGWAGTAWQLAGRPGRLLHAATTEEFLAEFGKDYDEWGVYMTDERPVGVPASALAVRVQLDAQLLDQKIAALCAMHTQTAPSLALLGADRFRVLNQQECYITAPADQVIRSR
jgi:LmbE family N-acetylglucosaminyl deacetylase